MANFTYIFLHKGKYLVFSKVTVTNNGNLKESDLKVVAKLPDNFVLNSIPCSAIYDESFNTLTCFIDDVDSKELPCLNLLVILLYLKITLSVLMFVIIMFLLVI